jgi:RNA polymerase sigma-70 factor (ECF subfamily)
MPAVLADWTGAPETLLFSAESLAEMNSAIAGLPPALRAAFVLRDLEQLSTEETAEALDITPGAVKVRLHRATHAAAQRAADHRDRTAPRAVKDASGCVFSPGGYRFGCWRNEVTFSACVHPKQ